MLIMLERLDIPSMFHEPAALTSPANLLEMNLFMKE